MVNEKLRLTQMHPMTALSSTSSVTLILGWQLWTIAGIINLKTPVSMFAVSHESKKDVVEIVFKEKKQKVKIMRDTYISPNSQLNDTQMTDHILSAVNTPPQRIPSRFFFKLK